MLTAMAAWVHATALPCAGVDECIICTLQAVLSPILSRDLSSETAQTVSHATWALFLAQKTEQGAEGQASCLADQLSTLLGAVAAVAAQLPTQWLTTDNCTAADLAAAYGAAARDVWAAAARASRLLAAALAAAAADPQASRSGSRAAAGGPKQLSRPGALSLQPEAAPQRMVAAAVWLGARYGEHCDNGGGSPCIDERGFAGWCPWQPSPAALDGAAPPAAAAVPAAPISAVTSWPAGCAFALMSFGSTHERLRWQGRLQLQQLPDCNACAAVLVESELCSAVVSQLGLKHMVHRRAYALEAAGGADSSTFAAAHPTAQQQQQQQQQQQPLEAAPEDAAQWLRHIVAAAGQQVPSAH